MDSRSYGVLLYADLSRSFGADMVFLDSESIPAGSDFVEQLLARVRECVVLLAVIGPRWLATVGGPGRRWIDDPADWVRREVAEAFAAGVTVVPVLTDDADLPMEADLPGEIAPLARCQYRRLRHRDATADLGRLRSDLIAAHPVLAGAARRRLAQAQRPQVVVAPAQLPADVYGFAGRAEHLARLDALLDGSTAGQQRAVVISAVSGTAGVGKTALAVHWSRRVAGQFPDGQLYVNLRGFDPGGRVTPAAEAVRAFLDALGVPAGRVPSSPDAQVGLYRSLLADRRVLVVLDNARDAEQVRPLLPGTPTALTVVTSRSQLAGLVATDGAYPLTLDLLTPTEARQLLAHRLGGRRVAAEAPAVEEIIARCARLPLALTIAAAHAATRPTFPLSAQLDRTGNRLDTPATGDPASDLRAVFSWSYRALSRAAARLFRLMGLHCGPDIAAAAAASLAGLPLGTTEKLLSELTNASLISEHTPGRYTFHDLLRAYAADLARGADTDADRHAAVRRVLDHYLHTAHTADQLLHPTRNPIAVPLTPPAEAVTPEPLADRSQATTWLTAERTVLLGMLDQAAADTGFDSQAWQLAWALATFLNRRGHWHDLKAAWQIALDAADRLDDARAQPVAHRGVAEASARLGRDDDAFTHLGNALSQYVRAGDDAGQAHVHQTLSSLSRRHGRRQEAFDHADRALTLARRAGHIRGQAIAHTTIGMHHALLGEHTLAITHCEQALALQRDVTDDGIHGDTWDTLGDIHHNLGDHRRAIDSYQHALDLYRDIGDRFRQATTLTCLGDVHHTIDDAGAARTAWLNALDILADLNHPDMHNLYDKLHNLHQTSKTHTTRSRPAQDPPDTNPPAGR